MSTTIPAATIVTGPTEAQPTLVKLEGDQFKKLRESIGQYGFILMVIAFLVFTSGGGSSYSVDGRLDKLIDKQDEEIKYLRQQNEYLAALNQSLYVAPSLTNASTITNHTAL